MSLVLNMISGGGGISPNSALLIVYTPLGSSVTATNGTVTKTSSTGIALSDRPTIEIHLFSINSSQYGAWTVTATRGTDTNSTTIVVNAVERYELYISYHVPINTYQEVAYLESSGTQYILAGLSSQDINGYNCDFQFTVQYSGNNLYSVFGSRYQISTVLEIIGISHWAGTISFDPALNATISADTNRHTVQVGEKYGWVTTVDGNNLSTTHGNVPSGNRNVDNVGIFASRQRTTSGSSMTGQSSVRIYRLDLYLGSTTQREFYPCYRLSDSVAGLYDKAHGVFYTNNGSGTFTVGADV